MLYWTSGRTCTQGWRLLRATVENLVPVIQNTFGRHGEDSLVWLALRGAGWQPADRQSARRLRTASEPIAERRQPTRALPHSDAA